MTATVGLRERKKARTREALRDAALDLFTRNGFEQTTVEDIAEACEVSPRTFFRYFPTKEDVLFSDADERCGRLLTVIADRPADEPLLQAILAGSLAVAADYDAERARLVARKRILESSPQLRAYSAERQRGWEDAVVHQLSERPRSTAPERDAPFELRLVAATGLAALRVALDAWLADDDAPELEVLVEQAFRRVGEGLDRPPLP
jgi:AcrR family transcriptional regulator